MQAKDLQIKTLGKPGITSPLSSGSTGKNNIHTAGLVSDNQKILFENRLDRLADNALSPQNTPAFELAGPRAKIFFNPSKTTAGVVTCGGLCPGLNDVIRGLVMALFYRYGVKKTLGFRYGYNGFVEESGHETLSLLPDNVDDIHDTGGTILGTSRGPQSASVIVDRLIKEKVNLLFTIGGDGTQRGALDIACEIEKRKLKIAVIGIPKTIDNDILYIDKSFGFETAFSVAFHAVSCAHTEAKSAFNGIGLVKLMGRDSGFIACHTALAAGLANFVLIPEVPFAMQGPEGLLEHLKRRLQRRRHACIIVSEGAGQNLIADDKTGQADASGNVAYKDVGLYLKHKFSEFLTACDLPHTVKYIDPSYIIRSVPANADDSLYCLQLAQAAVHAGMTGRTEMIVGPWHGELVHMPMTLITQGRRKVDPQGRLWRDVLEATGQPIRFE